MTWKLLLRRSIWVATFAVGACSSPLYAQQQAPEVKSELEQLKQSLQQIAARLDKLEQEQAARVATPATPAQAATPAPTGAPPESAPVTGPAAVKQAEDAGKDTMDAGMGGQTIDLPYIPALKIRGFGDVRGLLANQNLAVLDNTPGYPTIATQGGNSTFALGIMDLFITSQISPHFSYLSEVGFEADPASNGVGVDLERAQLSFTLSDSFSLTVGRTHAMLGYYNTAFHHGTWFQTTIDRPRIFEFEDSGGPLPIHNVGVSAMGKIRSGKLGLHWFSEVGNGKQTYSLVSTVTPANVLADHTGKSTNVGLLVRPDSISGFEAGFNWYQASLVPVLSLLPGFGDPNFAFAKAVDYYHQNLYVAHIVYITPKLELMAEDAEVRDTPRGSVKPLYLSGGYAQVSRAFGVLRPYARLQWMNPNFRDPNNAWVGKWVGPSAGVRWDINAFVAFKLEYSHFDWKNFSADSSGTQLLPLITKTVHQLGAQMTYTF